MYGIITVPDFAISDLRKDRVRACIAACGLPPLSSLLEVLTYILAYLYHSLSSKLVGCFVLFCCCFLHVFKYVECMNVI